MSAIALGGCGWRLESGCSKRRSMYARVRERWFVDHAATRLGACEAAAGVDAGFAGYCEVCCAGTDVEDEEEEEDALRAERARLTRAEAL